MTNAVLEPVAPERKPTLSEERLVVQKVLARLGRPANLYRVDAKKVWDGQYRVNVYCTTEAERAVKPVTMTDSFFVRVADDEIKSVPEIARRYE